MPGPDPKNPETPMTARGTPLPRSGVLMPAVRREVPGGEFIEGHSAIPAELNDQVNAARQKKNEARQGRESVWSRMKSRLFSKDVGAQSETPAAAVEVDTVHRDPAWLQTARGERPATSRFEGPPASPVRGPGALPFQGPPATSTVQGPPAAAAAAGSMHYQTVLQGPPSVSPQRKGPNPAAGPQH